MATSTVVSPPTARLPPAAAHRAPDSRRPIRFRKKIRVSLMFELLVAFTYRSLPQSFYPAAGMFLKFLTEPAQTAHFSVGTGYPSVIEGPAMTAVFAETRQARTAVDQLGAPRVQDRARAFVPSGDQYPSTAIERITLQNENPATVFFEITATYEQNVARYL
jgi:hypothetical protein